MKKFLTLVTLALIGIGSAWAATESSGNTGAKDTPWNGTSCTLDGRFIAGSGGVKQGNMPDKGVKLRSNQSNLVFEVNDGIKITSFKFWGCGNTTTAVDVVSATVDGGSNLLGATVTMPGKGTSSSGDISLTGLAATDNITLTFADGSNAQIVGTWQIEYIVEKVVVQEISGVTLNGTAISASDLSTLKSTKAVTIDGTSLNGVGAVNVTLSSGSTTVNREFSGTSAIYTFTINTSDEYTITVTNAVKDYDAAIGNVGYFSKNGTEATGANSSEVVADGLTFTYASKSFQYGTGSVTLGSDTYVPLKLSTGEAFTVAFPTGKKATKLIVYGWSVSGNGKLNFIKESSADGAKSVDCSADIFYATNTSTDAYPSVYEYDLDNWESLYISAGGSPSQPFIVIQVLFAEAITIPSSGYATIASAKGLDFSGVSGLEAYTVSALSASAATLTKVDEAPASTGLVLKGTAGESYLIPIKAGAAAVGTNKLYAAVEAYDAAANEVMILQSGQFHKVTEASTVPAGKAYLKVADVPAGARVLDFVFGEETTGINSVNSTVNNGQFYNLQGVRVAQPTKGLYIVNGKKVVVK